MDATDAEEDNYLRLRRRLSTDSQRKVFVALPPVLLCMPCARAAAMLSVPPVQSIITGEGTRTESK